MNGNFTYHNPTRLHFGENAMDFLKDELAAFGPTVQLCYGGGSIKKNGIYDQVVAALTAAGKTIIEDGGVMPNPTLEKLRDGAILSNAGHFDVEVDMRALHELAESEGLLIKYKILCWSKRHHTTTYYFLISFARLFRLNLYSPSLLVFSNLSILSDSKIVLILCNATVGSSALI